MSENRASLSKLARLARERPALLAGLLHSYQESEGLDDAGLAAYLQCDPASLVKLALCTRPRPAPLFRPDVERIAAYVGANPVQLMRLIRAAESRAALRSVPDAPSALLQAARDHDRPDGGPLNEEAGDDDPERPPDRTDRG